MARTKLIARKLAPKVKKNDKNKNDDEINDGDESITTNESEVTTTNDDGTTTTTTTTINKSKKITKGKKRSLEEDDEEEKKEGEEEEDEEEGNEGTGKKIKTEYSCDEPKVEGQQLKIISWNVAGFKAVNKSGLFIEYMEKENPDVICIQESKIKQPDINKDWIPKGYNHTFIHCKAASQHHGVGVFYKSSLGDQPKVTTGISIDKHDSEGRVITLEFEKFYLVNTYVPNSGTRGLTRLDYRIKEWDVDLQTYLKKLDTDKPVVWCGDLNVAHHPIDLKNPKTNTKSAGFTIEERTSFGEFLNKGFIDSYRHYNPGVEGAYTFWSRMRNARATNAGWRLDYFVVSKRFINSIKTPFIRNAVLGSDHCPLGIIIDLNESLTVSE